MTRLPSTQTLIAFEAAARHRSYTHAAQELNLTHSAISQRIRELEGHTGTPLFIRLGRCMQPTAFGELVLAQVRPALALLDRVFTRPGLPVHALRLSVLPAFASCWLMPRLLDFRMKWPTIDLELHASTNLVMPGEAIDLAIRYGPGGWKGVHAIKLAAETLTPVCAPSYRKMLKLKSPCDLARATLLINPWQPWAPWFSAAGLPISEPKSGPRYAESGLILQAARAGDGVALARKLLIQDDIENGRLVQLFDLQIPDSYAYYAVRFDPSETRRCDIDAFVDWLSQRMAYEASS